MSAEELSRAEERLAARQRIARALRKQLAALTARSKAADAAVATTKRTVARLRRKRGSGAAIAEAAKHVGHREDPPGSNRSPLIVRMCVAVGIPERGGFAWCGLFVWFCAFKAGVKGLTRRCLFVPFIIEDAKACRNGFGGFIPTTSIKAGDFVCMDFGGSAALGEHVGLAIADYDPGTRSVRTIEGNTSSGSSGSQSNGGGVFQRVRPASQIVGGARPRYPS